MDPLDKSPLQKILLIFTMLTVYNKVGTFANYPTLFSSSDYALVYQGGKNAWLSILSLALH